MNAEADQDSPEVQRDGFEVVMEAGGVDPRAINDFFTHWFDSSATWDENVSAFRAYAKQAEALVGVLDDDDVDRLFDEN